MNDSNKSESKFRKSLIYGLAGFAGNLSGGILYPLELIKTRLQVDERNLKLQKLIGGIYKNEGLRGFYRGFYYSIFASGISNCLFFYNLEYLNNTFNNKGSNYTPKKQLILSYVSGLFASMITMPIWTLKTRISLITLNKNESSKIKNRFSLVYLVIKESIQKDGFFSLYKGAFSSMILSFHGGIQMTIYETLKHYILRKERKSYISNSQGSLIGVFSKIAASMVLYPFNVIRARQQQFTNKSVPKLHETLLKNMIVARKEYGLFYQAAVIIYKNNDIRGFYKGLAPTILRQIPSSSLFFYTYEYTLKCFDNNERQIYK